MEIKDLTQDQIALLVEQVARRVAERLQQEDATTSAPSSPQKAAIGSPASGAVGCPVPASPADYAAAAAIQSGATTSAQTTTPTEKVADAKQILSTGASRVGSQSGTYEHCGDIAHYIDHTQLKPNAKQEEIEMLCAEARQHKFASVCINPAYVALCSQLLAGSGVKVCTVIGFPLGSATTESKAFETRDAIRNGAEEIDMVINIGMLRSGNYDYVFNDIRAVVVAAQGLTVKAIIETAQLIDDEKIAACVLAKAAGSDFVKTSTGFGGGGATAKDVALMRRIVGPKMGIKAAGGIRDCASASEMIAAGATRIGASASVAIVKGEQSKSSY